MQLSNYVKLPYMRQQYGDKIKSQIKKPSISYTYANLYRDIYI